MNMFELSKQVLTKVSFDKTLFKKELKKSLKWLKKEEAMLLKIWCLTTFVQYSDTIREVYETWR
ncbi:MAG: hypothetical protein HUU48_01070 [Flavobacteriales bacterium]|nr:hypothetical protein [Flavobacteriales bacterium]